MLIFKTFNFFLYTAFNISEPFNIHQIGSFNVLNVQMVFLKGKHVLVLYGTLATIRHQTNYFYTVVYIGLEHDTKHKGVYRNSALIHEASGLNKNCHLEIFYE